MPNDSIATIIAKEEIRELVALYSRGINRKDFDLLQSLYTADATDNHGRSFFASIPAFIARLREVLPQQRHGSLFVCNHLIEVNGSLANGEVYALSYHFFPDGSGGWAEHKMRLRYVDTYRKEGAQWRFATRTLVIDHDAVRPVSASEAGQAELAGDPSYHFAGSRLFSAGPRT